MLGWKALGAVAVSTGLLVGCSSHFLSSFIPASVVSPAPAPVRTVVTAPAPEPAAPAQEPPAPAPAAPAPAAPAPSAPGPTGDPYVDGAPALAPVDPLLPPAGEVPAVWQHLDETVRRLAGEAKKGRMSVVAVDLTTGARYEYRPNDRYYPASTFKLPVTLCTVQAIERGELTWETPVTFTKADDDTVGQGGFATTAYGTLWPVRNLVDRSLISSNNVAVKMLARTLTWDGLARCTEAMGGMVTRTEEGSTPVTAADEAAWWQTLWNMKQSEPAQAENLLRPLRQVPYYGRIQSGTPRPDLVTHKFGTFPPYEHDGAIVWGDRPYILVTLTYGFDHVGVDWTIEQIARSAWDSIYAK
ncbi:MAG TPA: serine hydrolase [Symbiobacteriaceae bacterium]|nr:serine hydrolase [Symbiobacteriaceae bacterium]